MTNNKTVDLQSLVTSSLSIQELTKVLKSIDLGEDNISSLKEEQVIREAIVSAGLIDKLTEKVKADSLKAAAGNGGWLGGVQPLSTTNENKVDATVSKRKEGRQNFIKLTIVKGRALLSLDDEGMNLDATSSLQVHVQFENARFSSKRVMSDIEPLFNESVEFNLPSRDVNLLVDLDASIHIVLTQTSSTSACQVVGVAQLEWRKILHAGRISALVELTDQSHHQMTVGILDVILELLPGGANVRKDEIEYHIRKNEKRELDLETTFFIVARQWWADYLQIRESHANRLVKIFSNDEFGRRLPVTKFVGPLSSRWLETPRHAARFVSLIAYSPFKLLGDSKMEIWQSTHSFMSVQKGDVQDHCLLLCSLLLGFFMEAYVTLGTNSNNIAHFWVTTIDLKGNATFWEPVTGQTYSQHDYSHPFRSVGCLFNNSKLYANIQVADAASKIKFNLQEATHWKCLKSPTASLQTFQFKGPSILDTYTTEFEVEQVLRQLIEYYRQDHHLLCQWDDNLSALLGQSLWSLEHSKVAGVGSSTLYFTEDFQMGVKRSLPEGHTFKGYPMAFNHTHPQRIMQALIGSKQCKDILLARGADAVRMALRVKLFGYCENVICCWIMIGSRFL